MEVTGAFLAMLEEGKPRRAAGKGRWRPNWVIAHEAHTNRTVGIFPTYEDARAYADLHHIDLSHMGLVPFMDGKGRSICLTGSIVPDKRRR